ncbi:MAG: LuxR C-terminal-related transcriptional regulator, partial [Rubrobacteraceae bacterium]
RFEAVRLFIERAKERTTGFEITEENSRAVVEICRKLEGMPLSIELATARLPVLSEAQISRRLEDSLSLLTTGGRGASPRHRTLRATLEWSHDLLDEGERKLFRRLSVFAGGWTLEAAEAVGAERDSSVLDILGQLVNKSLVSCEVGFEEVRYGMLEPIRQYGREKLEESGEEGVVLDLHAEFFLALAEEAEPELAGPDQGPWMKRLEAEHDNLRSSLGWFEKNGQVESGFRLGGAVWRFWWLQGRFAEGRARLEVFLDLPGAEAVTGARAKALYVLGVLACRQADPAAGNQDEARAYQGESLRIYRELRDGCQAAATLRELGRVSIELGDWETADSFLEESLKLERGSENEYGVALTLNSLGWLAHFRGENASARSLFERARETFHDLGDDLYADICAFFLGRIATDEGDYAKAHALLASTVDERIAQYPWVIPPLLEAFAGLAAAQGQAARALELAGAAAALREEIGVAHAPAWRTDITRRLSPAWRKLGEKAGARAWSKGRAMTPERAIAYAMEDPRPEPRPDGLTKREVEVIRLLASGKMNKEIAAELVLSVATVERHVANIYKKIGVRGRAEATAYAMNHGIAEPPS